MRHDTTQDDYKPLLAASLSDWEFQFIPHNLNTFSTDLNSDCVLLNIISHYLRHFHQIPPQFIDFLSSFSNNLPSTELFIKWFYSLSILSENTLCDEHYPKQLIFTRSCSSQLTHPHTSTDTDESRESMRIIEETQLSRIGL